MLAFLSRLAKDNSPSLAGPGKAALNGYPSFSGIANPKPGDWPTYHGRLNGNRYSGLDQINTGNVSRLQLQWIYPIDYRPLETTPLVAGGMMFVTGPNQVSALDGH